ncbi:hypothetical protein ACSTIR_02360 [Vibrio parahaemolyticus]|uniref:hypothetical protein n=1 Tax=Vibrio parahaemolyticus TaxID=670 RepID=UPI001F305ECB|nr:hypothetical protein [Vibrio parahaemolyticus]MBE4137872.1 hypothetical protein [Vibrio parahaemolyticus]MCG0035194.1 hypothetical protein [Vibrio parahaemolyticus]MCX8944382.1 hypothetical protein [Vibrio parahaemolyticus]
MTSITEENRTIDAQLEYKSQLRSIKPENPYFEVLHNEYYDLIQEVFKRLIQNGDLVRKEEFLQELEMFRCDMIRKYTTTSMYGYSPRSPLEKKNMIPHESSKLTALLELQKRIDEDDGGLSF